MRSVCIDYGDARIGVAASDDLGLLAHPLETVPAAPRPQALGRIAEIIRTRRAEMVVLGLPVRADGTEGPSAEKVRRFAKSLQAVLPAGMRREFQDEYRSTVAAAEQLRAAGRRARNHKPIIDQAAAVVILQEFLDARAPSLLPPPED